MKRIETTDWPIRQEDFAANRRESRAVNAAVRDTLKRVARYLRKRGHPDLAKQIMRGEHWKRDNQGGTDE